MHLAIRGSGPDVLFLHGAGISSWQWDDTLALLKTPIRAIVPDLPGFGASAATPYRSHRETLAELDHELTRRQVGPVMMVGFSMGGQLVMDALSTWGDRVTGAIILSSLALPVPLAGLTGALTSLAAPLTRIESFVRLQAQYSGIPAAHLTDFVADTRSFSAASLGSSIRENNAFRASERLASVTQPATVMYGSRESPFVRRSARWLRETIPHARVHEVPKCRHTIPFERPDAIASEIDRMLEPA